MKFQDCNCEDHSPPVETDDDEDSVLAKLRVRSAIAASVLRRARYLAEHDVETDAAKYSWVLVRQQIDDIEEAIGHVLGELKCALTDMARVTGEEGCDCDLFVDSE